MLSPRRSAQLGLSAASLTLVTSVAILIAGSTDPSKAPANVTPAATSSHITPLASGQFSSAQLDQTQHVAIAK